MSKPSDLYDEQAVEKAQGSKDGVGRGWGSSPDKPTLDRKLIGRAVRCN